MELSAKVLSLYLTSSARPSSDFAHRDETSTCGSKCSARWPRIRRKPRAGRGTCLPQSKVILTFSFVNINLS